MAKAPTSGSAHEDRGEKGTGADKKVCGIVMPIASMGEDYPEEHWVRVRRILERAIDRAGMRAQLVWENPAIDVIQSVILQNIYENDVVICDVSGLNPNVMLEAGLRLSTKRPTVIVTDLVLKPPFDIHTIGYIDYQHDLEYNAIDQFIERLSDKLSRVLDASIAGNYVSFVENYSFITVEPEKVTVPAEQVLSQKIDDLARMVSAINVSTNAAGAKDRPVKQTSDFVVKLNSPALDDLARRILGQVAVDGVSIEPITNDAYSITVSFEPFTTKGVIQQQKSRITRLVVAAEEAWLHAKNASSESSQTSE